MAAYAAQGLYGPREVFAKEEGLTDSGLPYKDAPLSTHLSSALLKEERKSKPLNHTFCRSKEKSSPYKMESPSHTLFFSLHPGVGR